MGPPGVDGVYVQDPRQEVAIKVISHNQGVIPTITSALYGCFGGRENPMLEIEIMRRIGTHDNGDGTVGHPNVMNCIEVSADAHNVYLVMPLMNGGELFYFLTEQRFHERGARECMRQVCEGVEYMHRLGISHLDISAENVMIHRTDEGEVRYFLIDFGQAGRQVHNPMAPDGFELLPGRSLRTAPGKHLYYAPDTFMAEVVQPYCGLKIDVWQLGILMILVCSCSPPFEPTSVERILSWLRIVRQHGVAEVGVSPPVHSTLSGQITLRAGYPTEFPVIAAMLTFQAAERPRLADILQLPYFHDRAID